MEMVKNITPITLSLVTNSSTFVCQSIKEVMDCKKYAGLNRLLRVTSYVIRFIKKCRKQTTSFDPFISPCEMNQSELLWIKSVQQSIFAREIQYLCSCVGQCPLLVKQFGLFLDDQEVLRCKGRLNNSSLCMLSKNPAILPCDGYFVELLVLWAHQNVKHSGVADTLTFLRELYWILKGCQVVRRVVKSCTVCRKFEGPSYSSVSAPVLPNERVSDHPPFTHTGVDFAGPLYISEKNVSEKVYICLFTCASMRAIHLELTPDMGVDSFLLAMRRFASRRGMPATLMSDNAKTFSHKLNSLSRSPDQRS